MAILTSGVWTVGKTGAAMTTEAFNSAIPGGGGFIVAIGLLLFAYSTILGWSYYGERCAEFVLGKRVNMTYRILWIPFIVIGAVGGLEAVWDVSDTMNGLMAIPNLIGLLLLSNIIVTETKEFFNNIYVKEMAVKAAEEIAPE
ncbi:MAG: alanine:cation symporter family protein [Bacillota bacterium]|nr:alanine:cation symporter family protein [Bacillota bacterium]MDW7685374.1 alanine:cation symporter family protein [Bacillota bacterium]